MGIPVNVATDERVDPRRLGLGDNVITSVRRSGEAPGEHRPQSSAPLVAVQPRRLLRCQRSRVEVDPLGIVDVREPAQRRQDARLEVAIVVANGYGYLREDGVQVIPIGALGP